MGELRPGAPPCPFFALPYPILIAILVVIGPSSVAASGITPLGISSLQQISEQTGLVARTSNEAILLARINTNIQAINAALYQIVSDPRPENRRTAPNRAGRSRGAAATVSRRAVLNPSATLLAYGAPVRPQAPSSTCHPPVFL
jgi:hypothetical protein